MRRIFVITFVLLCLASAAVQPSLVSANFQTEIDRQLNAAGSEQGGNLGTPRDPLTIAALVIKSFLGVLGILLVCYMIYAGFLWMTSAGNSEQVDEAKRVLRHSIIGLLIILSSYSIAIFVEKLVTGDAAHQGDYTEIAPDNSRFFNPDPLNQVK